MRVGHTWFQDRRFPKLTFYPNLTEYGQPRDIDHILIDGRSSSCLEDVGFVPELTISTREIFVNGQLLGQRMSIAKLRRRVQKPET